MNVEGFLDRSVNVDQPVTAGTLHWVKAIVVDLDLEVDQQGAYDCKGEQRGHYLQRNEKGEPFEAFEVAGDKSGVNEIVFASGAGRAAAPFGEFPLLLGGLLCFFGRDGLVRGFEDLDLGVWVGGQDYKLLYDVFGLFCLGNRVWRQGIGWVGGDCMGGRPVGGLGRQELPRGVGI